MDSYKGYEIFYTSGLLSDKILSDVQLNSHMTFFCLDGCFSDSAILHIYKSEKIFNAAMI